MKLIGIDPGLDTGFAIWNALTERLERVCSQPIHRALHEVACMAYADARLAVIFEDARKRTWFGNADERQRKYGAAVREGVGSVKRDCTIWEDFLTEHGIAFVARKPIANGTKWPSGPFARATRWTQRTNEHGRDAAMLVYGMPLKICESIVLERDKAIEARPDLKAGTHADTSAHTPTPR